MKWFEGSIPDAIEQSRTSRSLFVVYIFGEDSDSARLTQSFENDDVSQSFIGANCVAVKFHIKSEHGAQFCQIYPVVLVPCVFFIGDKGIPLEVTGGYLPPEELIQKLNKAVQMHSTSTASQQASQLSSLDHLPENQGTSSPSPSESQSPCTASSEQQLPFENDRQLQYPTAESGAQISSSTATQSSCVTDASASPDETEASASSSDSSQCTATRSLEEKKERANQLLAKKRDEKAREEEQKEKEQEIERRRLGQEMAKLKQWKEDQEKKQFENSYKKQKEEERLAREKVLADIERDRQERATRYHQGKADKEAALAKQQAEKLASKAEAEERINAAKMESARIQFRLPDGSTVTNVFPSSELLAAVRNYISQRMLNTGRAVTLSTIYPKRTFTEADMALSLLQLELAPSAIIVVLPTAQSTAGKPADQTGILFPLWWLLGQLMALWAVISSLFVSQNPQQQPVLLPQSQDTAPELQQQTSRGDSEVRQRQSRSEGVKRRVEGNIHRLTADDDDDENATWNGNSTQQM